jgi:hypothetical protein
MKKINKNSLTITKREIKKIKDECKSRYSITQNDTVTRFYLLNLFI